VLLLNLVAVAVVPRVGQIGPARRTSWTVQAVRGATTMWLAEKPARGCPTVADLVGGGYLDGDKSTTDAWGRPMATDCKGTRVTVTSAGADGLFGTDDDID